MYLIKASVSITMFFIVLLTNCQSKKLLCLTVSAILAQFCDVHLLVPLKYSTNASEARHTDT